MEVNFLPFSFRLLKRFLWVAVRHELNSQCVYCCPSEHINYVSTVAGAKTPEIKLLEVATPDNGCVISDLASLPKVK